MPKLLEVLYQGYFPSLHMIKEIKDVRYSLAYLAHFGKMPFFLPKLIMELIEKKISMNAEISFKEFKELSHIIFLMMFHFGSQLESIGVKKQC